jgi:hypothetical protein
VPAHLRVASRACAESIRVKKQSYCKRVRGRITMPAILTRSNTRESLSLMHRGHTHQKRTAHTCDAVLCTAAGAVHPINTGRRPARLSETGDASRGLRRCSPLRRRSLRRQWRGLRAPASAPSLARWRRTIGMDVFSLHGP